MPCLRPLSSLPRTGMGHRDVALRWQLLAGTQGRASLALGSWLCVFSQTQGRRAACSGCSGFGACEEGSGEGVGAAGGPGGVRVPQLWDLGG